MARPVGTVVYKPEDFVESLCEWLADGKPLAAWCRQPGNPSAPTVYGWGTSLEWFATRVARAREIGFAVIADDCMTIADDDSRDWLDSSAIARAKLRVETRAKLLACWKPSVYGNKVAVGGDTDAPPIKVLTSVERAHRIQVLLAQVAARAASKNEAQELLS